MTFMGYSKHVLLMTMFCSIMLKQRGLVLCLWEDNSGVPLSGPHTFHSLIHEQFHSVHK